jgi:GNAT superfamily N-acetyltransferase
MADNPAIKMTIVYSRVRNAISGDLGAIKSIIDATGLFPSSMIDDMIAPYFEKDGACEHWLVVEDQGEVIGLAYATPERMTAGTWNLLLIAVHPASQGKGAGSTLVSELEGLLQVDGNRVLLVETSGLAEFESTQAFYIRNGFRVEARIKDFYQEGEDKIVFWKKLKLT